MMTAAPLSPAARLRAFVKSDLFRNVVTALILVNALIIGMQTSDALTERYGGLLRLLDVLILGFFVIELALRLWVDARGEARSGWFWFDAAVVSIAVLPTPGNLAVLRTLRVLRVLRLLSVSPRMRRVVTGLLGALPGMATVIGVLLIVFYVFAVFATETFGQSSNPESRELFGTLGASLFTLFQIMTLEDWSGIARPLMEEYPWAWLYFVSFLIVTAFAVLNLFIGIIVDAMQDDRDAAAETARHREDAERQAQFDALMREMRDLRAQVAALRRSMDDGARRTAHGEADASL